MESREKNPNFLHWAGFAMLMAGYFLLLQLKLVWGFSIMFAGCGTGLLGCWYENHRRKR